jgi:hypothetical protein
LRFFVKESHFNFVFLVTPYFNKKAMQELPIGIQSFSELRKYDFLYVDKTEDILYKKSNRTFRLIITQTDFSLSKTNPNPPVLSVH